MPNNKKPKAQRSAKSAASKPDKNVDATSSTIASLPMVESQILPPSQVPDAPTVVPNPSTPPSSQSPVVPKQVWGRPLASASETSTLPKPASDSPVPSASGPATVSKSAPNSQLPPPSPPSEIPKCPWGPQASPASRTSTVLEPTLAPQRPPANEPSTVPKSGSSHSSRFPDRTERSSSVRATVNESMRSLSVNKATSVSNEPRSQSALSTKGRRFLCSAVPDSAILSPIRRPDNGGTSGNEISVYTNHFRVEIGDATVNQYDVEILAFDFHGQLRPARKDDRWEVVKRIAQEKKNFPLVWYDEGKTLYTRALLTDFTEPIKISLNRGDEIKKFQLDVKNLVRQEKISSITDFIQKKTSIRPRETVRIIETLFKQRARNDLVSVRNQFYDRNQILDDLKDGRGMAKGFYQALFLIRCGPTINVNLTFTCFYIPMNFVQFACKYLRKDITKDFSEHEAKLFRKIVRDLLIETEHTGRKIRYKLRRFGLPADQLTFPRGDPNENSDNPVSNDKVFVKDYFKDKYKIELKYPNLPCIDATNGGNKRANWLPMEVVTVAEWQRSFRPLDTTQRGLVSSKSIIKPLERYNQIMSIMHKRDFDSDVHLKELNVHVHNKEMLEIKARVLRPPAIQYRTRYGQGETMQSVDVGGWKIRNWFYTTPEIQNWGIVYFGHPLDKDTDACLRDFAKQLPELLKLKGFMIKPISNLIIKSDRKQDVENALQDASKNRWQLVVVVLNTRFDQVYNYVKKLGNQRLGVRTQCVDMNALLTNRSKLHMYVDNLSQKINGKLGGINSVVNIKLALSRSSKEDLFMFFGADVTHSTCSTDRPSVAAVVASRDPTNTLYAARLCEQYPKKGRCSMEIIKELDCMVADLLRVFARTCGGRLPNKIVFYRDGVDEGQYQKVLDNEVNKIKNACRIVYGKNPLPKLTFIVVKKRHNTRFFLYQNQNTLNIQAGTVIDQSITHPSQFDFYLCSQAAIMGTSRPALYHVLHDDIGFSSDDIQQLTYWLCHTDMRCTKSVSIPAPVHYAHLAAYGSRSLSFDNDRETENSEIDDDDEEPRNYSLDDIKTQLMILDPKVADDMWFV